MNRRQKLKKLKRDNKLMHDIINNSSEMKELYRAYNEPIKNVVHISRYQHFRVKQSIAFDDVAYAQNSNLLKTHIENRVLQEIRPLIWNRLVVDKVPYAEAYVYSLDLYLKEATDE